MAPKQKLHRFLSIKDKCKILRELDAGHPGFALAEKYGVSKSTITGIKLNSMELLDHFKQTESGPGKRKTLRKSEMPKMENALFEWLKKQRENHIPVSTELLCRKANHFNLQFKEARNFKASQGWVYKFKQRPGVRTLKICGEKLSCNKNAVNPFLEKLHETIKEMSLTPQQIYNADETILCCF